MPHGHWTNEEDQTLVRLIASGLTIKEAAAKLGREPQVVHSHMHYRRLTKRAILAKVRAAEDGLAEERRRIDLTEDVSVYLPKEVGE